MKIKVVKTKSKDMFFVSPCIAWYSQRNSLILAWGRIEIVVYGLA